MVTYQGNDVVISLGKELFRRDTVIYLELREDRSKVVCVPKRKVY